MTYHHLLCTKKENMEELNEELIAMSFQDIPPETPLFESI
jgi:hypothetical protein